MAFSGLLSFYLDIPFNALLFSLFCSLGWVTIVGLKLSEQIRREENVLIDGFSMKAPSSYVPVTDQMLANPDPVNRLPELKSSAASNIVVFALGE